MKTKTHRLRWFLIGAGLAFTTDAVCERWLLKVGYLTRASREERERIVEEQVAKWSAKFGIPTTADASEAVSFVPTDDDLQDIDMSREDWFDQLLVKLGLGSQ